MLFQFPFKLTIRFCLCFQIVQRSKFRFNQIPFEFTEPWQRLESVDWQYVHRLFGNSIGWWGSLNQRLHERHVEIESEFASTFFPALVTFKTNPSPCDILFIKVHFDDVSLYGTPKEEPLPSLPTAAEKTSSNFLKNQLQAWFQPTDNRLAMKLFGSKKALVKERIRQKTAGHWVIHPCSSFRWVWFVIENKLEKKVQQKNDFRLPLW